MKTLFLALVLIPGVVVSQVRPYRMPRPYGYFGGYQRPLGHGAFRQSWTEFPGGGTFYRDSYGNYGSSVWVGSTRFDSFHVVRPVYNPYWGW